MQAKYGGVWWVSGWCLRVSGSVRMVSECVRQMSGVGRCHMQCQKLAETARLSENDTQKHQKCHIFPGFQKIPVPYFFVNCFWNIPHRRFKRCMNRQWYVFFDLDFVLHHCDEHTKLYVDGMDGLDGMGSLKHSHTRAPLCGANN